MNQLTNWDQFDIINKRLGRGSFGTAKLVKRKSDGKKFVAKVIFCPTEPNDENAAMKEVKVLKSLTDPNIVRYEDSWYEEQEVMILMEYCENGDLANLIQQHKENNMKIDKVLDLFIQICRGLRYCHDRHIIHRDLRPGNIFLHDGGRTVKIGDFGISKLMEDTLQTMHTTNAHGFPSYQAVELFKESKKYTSSVDIWALGCILFEMIHYKRFFIEPDEDRIPQVLALKLIEKVLENKHEPIEQSCPAEIKEMILNCVNVNPSERPRILELEDDCIKLRLDFTKNSEPTIIAQPQKLPASFKCRQITKMKYEISYYARRGITILNDNEVVITSNKVQYVHDKIDGHSAIFNTATREMKPLDVSESFIYSSTTESGFGTKAFFTGLRDGYILKWKNGEVSKKFNTGSITPLIKRHGVNLVVAALDKLFILTTSLEIKKELRSVEGRPLSLDVSSKFIAYGTWKNEVAFYEVSGSSEPTVYNHENKINCVAIDDDKLASGSEDHTIQVWNMQRRTKLYRCKHESYVVCVKFWHGYLISSSGDRCCKMWGWDKGQLHHTLQHDGTCYCFDIQKGLLAVATETGVTIWSLDDQQKLEHIELERVQDVRFQGSKIIAALYDGTVYSIQMKN